MLLLGAAVMSCGTLLQRFDQVIWKCGSPANVVRDVNMKALKVMEAMDLAS